MNKLLRPGRQPRLLRALGRVFVGLAQVLQAGIQTAIRRLQRCRNVFQPILDRWLLMIAPGRRLPLALEVGEQLVKQRQHPPTVKRRLQRMRIRLAGDVLEQFINAPPPLEHGIVFLLGPDQMRQRKLLGGEEQLQGMTKRDFKRFILTASPPLEQKFPLLGIHEQLWRLARASWKFLDVFDDPNVVMGKHNRQFIDREFFPLPPQRRLLPCPGDGRLNRGCNGLHVINLRGWMGEGNEKKPLAQPVARASCPRLMRHTTGILPVLLIPWHGCLGRGVSSLCLAAMSVRRIQDAHQQAKEEAVGRP